MLNLMFMRLVAIFLIVFAIQYWMRLIGVEDGAQFRFDTMDEHWRLACSVLAVLLPAAALGLWGGYAWGVVLWIVAVAMELAMHAWLTPLFGRADLLVTFHLVGVVVLIAFRVVIRIMANKT